MKQWISNFFHRLLLKEKSPEKLAWSTCLGLFIAFSPFLGVQNVLIFVLSPLLRLNMAVVFLVAYTVNNPFTMIPIAIMDYFIGYWLFEYALGIPLSAYNPSWIQGLNNWMGKHFTKYLGASQFCLWCYLFGGLLVAFLLSVPWYTYIKRFFVKMLAKQSKDV